MKERPSSASMPFFSKVVRSSDMRCLSGPSSFLLPAQKLSSTTPSSLFRRWELKSPVNCLELAMTVPMLPSACTRRDMISVLPTPLPPLSTTATFGFSAGNWNRWASQSSRY